MKKEKRITFSVDEAVGATWQKVADQLIHQQRLYRSKAEIFENLVYFLMQASKDEIMQFRTKSFTVIV